MTALLRELKKFFHINFRQQFEQPGNGHTFRRPCPEKNLVLVCEFHESGQEEIFPPLQTVGSFIQVYVRRLSGHEERLVEFSDTRTSRTWEQTLCHKLRALAELVWQDTNPCGSCGHWEEPVTVVVAPGKKAVRLRCPRCGKQREVTHGHGLRSKIHKYLK